MQKIIIVLAVVAFVIASGSSVFATAVTLTGTIKSIDTTTATVVFCAENGKDVTLKTDKSVDLSKLKAGDKVEITVEDDVLKSVKPGHVNWCPPGY
jgi:hypothetical protein